jgi:hypothetical protein
MNTKLNIVQGVKIYPIDYLINEELTESDLSNLFDSKSFTYSLIINMFRENNIKISNSNIIKMISNDSNWMNKFSWNKDKFNEFEHKVKKVYENVYNYADNVSKQYAQWWMTVFGFSVK